MEDGKSYWQSNSRVTYALVEWLPQGGSGAYIVENSRSYELITEIMQEHAVKRGPSPPDPVPITYKLGSS